MDLTPNVALFEELLKCGNKIYLWIYDSDGNLIDSDCPDAYLFDHALRVFGIHERMFSKENKIDSPSMFGSEMDLIWGASYEKLDDKLNRVYVIGPVLFSDTSFRSFDKVISSYLSPNEDVLWKIEFSEKIKNLPIVQHTLLVRYLLMLHYCITGNHLDSGDLSINKPIKKGETNIGSEYNRHNVYLSEKALLHKVKFGDLNYDSVFTKSILISDGVKIYTDDPLRRAKNSIIIFASIVCRAAIEGGLSPDEAYTLGDYYIQTAENSKTLDELYPLSKIMYDDFIHRVHKCRTNPRYSPHVQRICDYIELNIDKKIRVDDIASLVGYSKYYISRIFKEETGTYINDYIKYAKIENAKLLLITTDMSINEISEQLCFVSPSYFGKLFKEITGETPLDYRDKNMV